MSLNQFVENIKVNPFQEYYGRVQSLRRDSLKVFIPGVKVGAICEVKTNTGSVAIEIVSLNPDGHVAMPLDDLGSVQLGDLVVLKEEEARVQVGEYLLGQVIDSLGKSYDGNTFPQFAGESVPLYGKSLNPMDRSIITTQLDLGIRSINACLSCGKGQRTGIFAGSGVGKSVLMGMMAKFTSADVVVIALIGERGREVKEFLENDLGSEARKKSVVVVETADQSPIRRVRGAYVATAVAEYYRNQGANVLLLMDSLTRFAMAQREIGMAAGEPPTSKGYTPSVFNHLSRLAERAGNWGDKGSITGLYTVLVEGDDLEDPVADSVRAILDGHIVLSRKLANRGHYPAIDILSSVSRVMDQVVDKEHRQQAKLLRSLMAKYHDSEDAIQFNLYMQGTDTVTDEAIEKEPLITKFLRQERDEKANLESTKQDLSKIFAS